jgi:hypothetical protein
MRRSWSENLFLKPQFCFQSKSAQNCATASMHSTKSNFLSEKWSISLQKGHMRAYRAKWLRLCGRMGLFGSFFQSQQLTQGETTRKSLLPFLRSKN